MKKNIVSLILSAAAIFICLSLSYSQECSNPYDIGNNFRTSGYMGCGSDCITITSEMPNDKDAANASHLDCFKITVSKDPEGWGGLFWLNKPDNWGDKSGENFSNCGYTKLTFWIKAKNDSSLGKKVYFESGMEDNGKRYKNSYDKTRMSVKLPEDWTKHIINLNGKNMSSIINAFGFVVEGLSGINGSEVTFFLDQIQFE